MTSWHCTYVYGDRRNGVVGEARECAKHPPERSFFFYSHGIARMHTETDVNGHRRNGVVGEARECARHPPDIRQSPRREGPRPCRVQCFSSHNGKNKRTQNPRQNAQGPERSVATRTQTQPPLQPSMKARKLSPKATQCSGEKTFAHRTPTLLQENQKVDRDDPT